MRRILFHFHGLPIHSYPAMLYVGIVSGIYLQLYVARRTGIDVAASLTATLVLLAAALLGARLLYVAAHWPIYREQPMRILRCADGGASMYGGILLAVPLSFPLLAILGIPFGAFWDLGALTMLCGMIITRAGCFLNGCCAGRATAGWWGISLPNYRGQWRRRIPTQILEAAWGCAVLAGAGLLWGRLPFPGAIFLYAIAGYGVGRLVLESLRDEPDRVGRISVHRAISALLILAAATGFAIHYWL